MLGPLLLPALTAAGVAGLSNGTLRCKNKVTKSKPKLRSKIKIEKSKMKMKHESHTDAAALLLLPLFLPTFLRWLQQWQQQKQQQHLC